MQTADTNCGCAFLYRQFPARVLLLCAKILLRRAERCCRHVDAVDAVAPERARERVGHCGCRRGDAAFATALDAERITSGWIERELAFETCPSQSSATPYRSAASIDPSRAYPAEVDGASGRSMRAPAELCASVYRNDMVIPPRPRET